MKLLLSPQGQVAPLGRHKPTSAAASQRARCSVSARCANWRSRAAQTGGRTPTCSATSWTSWAAGASVGAPCPCWGGAAEAAAPLPQGPGRRRRCVRSPLGAAPTNRGQELGGPAPLSLPRGSSASAATRGSGTKCMRPPGWRLPLCDVAQSQHGRSPLCGVAPTRHARGAARFSLPQP